MKEKKVAIITHYYKSLNFGGNLQAYALSKVLCEKGYEAELICYDHNKTVKIENRTLREKIASKGIKVFGIAYKSLKRKILKKIDEKKNNVSIRRAKAFSYFNHNIIPNSGIVYSDENIEDCINNYYYFIAGSDQIWNFASYKPAYFLNFVPKNKKKISYAASFSMDSLTEEQREIVKEHLKDFHAVSIREPSAIKLIEDICPVKPVCVLDPTLLLDKDKWDVVCADKVINEKYVFCYFLGINKKERKLAKKYSKRIGAKLVQIVPYAGADMRFGDIKIYDATPEQFISLIKYAEYIFTDSFHAVVFSNIYEKQYFVFNRNKSGAMNSRIKDITKLFNVERRFCDGKDRERMKYLKNLKPIDYSNENSELIKKKKESIEFLLNSLRG